MKICLIGPFPPPLGGVSVHLNRLRELLEKDCDVFAIDESPVKKKKLVNIRKLEIFGYLSILFSADVVHVHSAIRVLRYMHIFMSGVLLRKRTILTIHSLRVSAISRIEKLLYAKCNKVIIVNESYRNLISLDNVVYMPAFLPPKNFGNSIPGQMREWIERQRSSGRKIVASNASRLDRYNGVDIYGLDMAIELARLHKKNEDKIAIVFVVSSIEKYMDEYESYKRDIAEAGLGEQILLVGKAMNFPALIREADLVLRLTCTDGDALTIRESIWLGVNVLASDVVERPNGCHLFENRSVESLYKMEKDVLPIVAKDSSNMDIDYAKWYMNLYKGEA
jgi:glycosyltransferase involved in cell wall biosynthesis